MKKSFQSIHNATVDTIEPMLTPAIRAGHAVERAGKLLAQGIPPKTVAVVMTGNSRDGTKFTAPMVVAYGHIYQASCSGQVLPAKHYSAILADQKDAREQEPGGDLSPV